MKMGRLVEKGNDTHNNDFYMMLENEHWGFFQLHKKSKYMKYEREVFLRLFCCCCFFLLQSRMIPMKRVQALLIIIFMSLCSAKSFTFLST